LRHEGGWLIERARDRMQTIFGSFRWMGVVSPYAIWIWIGAAVLMLFDIVSVGTVLLIGLWAVCQSRWNERLAAVILVVAAADRIVEWGRLISRFGDFLPFSYQLMGIIEMITLAALACVAVGYAMKLAWVGKMEHSVSGILSRPDNYVAEALFLLVSILLIAGKLTAVLPVVLGAAVLLRGRSAIVAAAFGLIAAESFVRLLKYAGFASSTWMSLLLNVCAYGWFAYVAGTLYLRSEAGRRWLSRAEVAAAAAPTSEEAAGIGSGPAGSAAPARSCCGREYPADVNYCTNCGKKLGEESDGA